MSFQHNVVELKTLAADEFWKVVFPSTGGLGAAVCHPYLCYASGQQQSILHTHVHFATITHPV